MKHLKTSMMLLFMVAFFTSCEKETIEATEVTATKTVTSKRENLNLQFFYNQEEFPCVGYLPTENFNEVYEGVYTPSPLDENADYFNIPRGVSFESESGLFINSDDYYDGSWYKTLFSQESLVINFTINVKNVSMLVNNLNWSYSTTVEVYGASGIIGTTTIDFTTYYGTYVGFTAIETIKKIILIGTYPGVDNLTFGDCGDYDSDGVLNENDPYPNSNMSETLNIGGNDLNIDNVFAKPGTTMMDQIDALVAEINVQYTGDNYAYLHKRFMTKLAQTTYYWRKDRLITSSERSAISSAAWSAEIPYFNQPN